jgi:hypothetical protein
MMESRLRSLVSRRQVLQIGGIGALGLTLPGLLRASESRGGHASRTSKRSCIFIVQYGGGSHIDSLDPKPLAPAEIRGPYAPIATRSPDLQLGELLPLLAQRSDKYAVVRSMTHGNPGHDGGMHVAMTGHSMPQPDTPYFGSVASYLRPATRNIPSYVWLQNLAGDVEPRYLRGGFLGMAHSPLRVGTDLDNPSDEKFRFTAFDPVPGMTSESLLARRQLLNSLEPTADQAGPAAFGRFQEKAFELVTGPQARQAFDLAGEPDPIRDRYGRHALGQNLLMARRLVEAGVRLVNVTAWCGVAPGEKFTNVQTWDMHGPGAAAHLGSIFGTGTYGLGHALPRVDQAVSALLDDLSDRGLLDDTLVVMVGEFGRSPRISNAGRDHWPACYSALLAGAGVPGGLVYGSSDAQGGYVRNHPVTPEQFGATLLQGLGIDPGSRLSPDGFTMPASIGQPVPELLSA